MINLNDYGITPYGFRKMTYDDLWNYCEENLSDDISRSNLNPIIIAIKLCCRLLAICWGAAETVYYGQYIDYAEQVTLDYVIKYKGLTRQPDTSARHLIEMIDGTAEKIIPLGFMVQTPDGVRFSSTEEIALDQTGYGVFEVEAEETGEIGNVGSGSITVVTNPEPGFGAITNIEQTFEARDRESDYEARQRYLNSTAVSGRGTIELIYSALMDVIGVGEVRIIENDTMLIVNGQPPKSIHVLIYGGANEDIFEALYSVYPYGVELHGSIQQQYNGVDGQPKLLAFSRFVEVDILVRVELINPGTYDPSELKTVIIDYINSCKNEIIHSQLFLLIGKNVTANDYNILIGRYLAAMAEENIVLLPEERPITDDSKIEVVYQ